MRIASSIAACALSLVLVCAPVRADSPVRADKQEAHSPAHFARTLVMVQDQIIQGSTAALASVPELRHRLAMSIEKSPASVWKEPQQARALALHLLNGGAPQVIRKLVDTNADLGGWREIILALLAYAERRRDAAQRLSGFDARLLDPSIAGPFALAQAIAHVADPEKAKAYLRQAKLLIPGGLVEDSAMRREIEQAMTAGKQLEAAQAAARYLWRFGSSLYAKDVVEFLAGSLIPELAALPSGNSAIATLTDALPVPARIEMLMMVSRNAMLKGSLQAADFAAGRVADLAPSGSPELHRAALYRAIARAFSDPNGEAVDKLRESDLPALSLEDRGLLYASLSVLKRVRAPIEANAAVELSPSSAIQAARQAVSTAQDQLDQMRP